ncbi:hypothetical protein IC619_001015 [Hazenella sp. IB182353]|uniref:hypothetical protein n=1 Tax=Polycladospora coralii TaxID=2771432 RepID=UPI001746F446|nr:hypothetical protein [Polycladospora coralii]MBS7529073.1 hypothetical protein [Polycladospora coralii]
MWRKIVRLWVEMTVILTIVAGLKLWIFPFFIQLWLPDIHLQSILMEWTAVIIGVMVAFIYIGFGSSAKFVYQLPLSIGIIIFVLFHLIFIIPFHPLLTFVGEVWNHFMRDVTAPLLRNSVINDSMVFISYLVLYCIGFQVHVKTESADTEKVPQKMRSRTRGFDS